MITRKTTLKTPIRTRTRTRAYDSKKNKEKKKRRRVLDCSTNVGFQSPCLCSMLRVLSTLRASPMREAL